MGLTTDGQIMADGSTLNFPDNESGTIATREWVLANGGGGSTPGIDDVLGEEQVISANRLIDATGFGLTWTADTHTFNVPLVNGFFSVIGDGNNYLSLSPTTGFSASVAPSNSDIKSVLQFNVSETSSDFEIDLYFDDAKAVYIVGHAETGVATLESWASEHEWYVGNDEVLTLDATTATFEIDIIIAGLAGGGTTGLSIDNNGKIIRTP